MALEQKVDGQVMDFSAPPLAIKFYVALQKKLWL